MAVGITWLLPISPLPSHANNPLIFFLHNFTKLNKSFRLPSHNLIFLYLFCLFSSKTSSLLFYIIYSGNQSGRVVEMKGLKGSRILKKLKSIPHVGHLKQGRVLRLNASDGLLHDLSPPHPGRILCHLPITREEDSNLKASLPPTPSPFPSQTQVIDVAELMKDPDDEEMELGGNKENIRPVSPPKNPTSWHKKPDNSIQPGTGNHISELDGPTFRQQPDLNSDSLFDQDLLAAFEQAVMDHIQSYEEEEEAKSKKTKVPKEEESHIDEEEPPPRGMGAVVLYTTDDPRRGDENIGGL